MKRPLSALPTRKTLIAPSILAADFAVLGNELKRVELAGADVIHVDVMDGHFVPNLSLGPPVVKCLRPHSSLPFDVHLMITDPQDFVKPFADAGADHITVHVEAKCDVRALLDAIHAMGCSAGLCLKPATPATALVPFLEHIDLVLVMTVEPGFGGQAFRADMLSKIIAVRNLIDSFSRPVHLEVDGGIGPETAEQVLAAGANLLVAGTSVFRSQAPIADAIQHLRNPRSA